MSNPHPTRPREAGLDDRLAESPDTKDRLLDAAERLFAERGFVGTSMRAVTTEAAASVSAANYHFGSKEALLAAVMRRRLAPINDRRLHALSALEAAAAEGQGLELEAVLDTFLRPSFEHLDRAAREEWGSWPRQVVARLYADPLEMVEKLKIEVFGEINERYRDAFARALPGLDLAHVRLVQHLTIASMVHVLAGQLDEELTAQLASEAREGEKSYEPLLAALVAHTAAGARALLHRAVSAKEGR